MKKVHRLILGSIFLAALALGQAPTGQRAQVSDEARARMAAQTAELRNILQQSPRLSLQRVPLKITPPEPGWEVGMVSWVASDKNGLIYMLQRGDKADPVVVVNSDGKVLRTWGKGMFKTPHGLRIDPQGNIWTNDALSSMVYKFSPEGKELLRIEVGGQPANCRGNFCSVTDMAFAPNGHVYITDGYQNARVLEYTADGRKVREWGTPGDGPGQFHLPHSIQIDEKGIIYVADRENARVQRFDLNGKYLGEWDQYGRTFGLRLDKNAIWLSSNPRDGSVNAPGWLIKLDRETGKVLGYVESEGNHSLDVMPNGQIVQSPGPDNIPQLYRP